MSILITGGTGFIGVGLARKLLERGENIVLFDIAVAHQRVADIKDRVKIIRGDLSIWNEILNAVKENNVTGIFHLGAMLSQTSESNPWAAFQANVVGTMNVLEAARLFEVEKMIYSSALGTFGSGRKTDVVTDETLQRPITMYGGTKLYSELAGRFYRRKFNLDFRCLRYPSVIGPGVKSPSLAQYNPWMIEYAALGRPYECYVSADTAIPVVYFKDIIRAFEMLYDAPRERIRTVCYNLSGITPTQTAGQLESAIRQFIPDAHITYKPDPLTMEFARSLNTRVIDDSCAREEWGWQPDYADVRAAVADFIREVRERPALYGLP